MTSQKTLIKELQEIFDEGFSSVLNDAIVSEITLSNRPEFGQFQCNSAMRYAKEAKMNPRALAEKVIACIQDNSPLHTLSIQGPGFINFSLEDAFLADILKKTPPDYIPPLGMGKSVVLDFGGPNMAKAMHVGHLRSCIIGESLQRLYKAFGYTTISDVHLGDWGLPMGMLLVGLEKDNISIDDISITLLEELYPKMALLCKDDESLRQKAREYTARLQKKEDPFYDVWKKMRAVSLDMIQENFKRLQVHFDHYFGESHAQDGLESLTNLLNKKGLLELDEGAHIIHVEKEDDKKPVPPLMIQNRDGGATYGATDLETLRWRAHEFSPEEILYVVDQRQHLHFEQVFRAYKRFDPSSHLCLKHVGFGTLNGPDNKPFKTRDGGVMRLEMLLDMVLEQAKMRLDEGGKEYEEEEKNHIAQCIMLATLKFADLSTPRLSDYIFDVDKFSSFQGFTGPYLLYTHVRITALLKKHGSEVDLSHLSLPVSSEERELMILLTRMNDTALKALEEAAPHLLCHYAYDVAQAFSTFYAHHPILSEQDKERKNHLLALSLYTQKILQKLLFILGIPIPERM
jgi:arginyl-tRNA synthetase